MAMSEYTCPNCGKKFVVERAVCDRCTGRVWSTKAYIEWERLITDPDDTRPPANVPPTDTVTIIVPTDDV